MNIKLIRMKQDEKEAFYCYEIGKYYFWFSQMQDNGNIYSVSISVANESFKPNFSLYISGNGFDTYYPNKYEMSTVSWGAISIEEALRHSKDIVYGCKILEQIKEFFNNGIHYDLWKVKNTEDK